MFCLGWFESQQQHFQWITTGTLLAASATRGEKQQFQYLNTWCFFPQKLCSKPLPCCVLADNTQASHLRCLPRSGKPNKPHKLLTLQAERVSYRKPRGGAAPKGQAGNLSPVCGLRRAERGRKSPSCTELRAGLRQQQVKADGEQLGCSGMGSPSQLCNSPQHYFH